MNNSNGLPIPVCSVYLLCWECVCSWCCLGMSDSCTDFIQAPLPLCRSRYSQFLTHTLSLSVCLALSLPPTTHSVLYKSYINASSTTFWRWASHNRTFSESHCTQQKYLHDSLTSESYTVWCIWTRINNHKQHELSISEECTQQYWCMHRGDTNTYSVKRFEFDMMLLHRSSIHKIRNVLEFSHRACSDWTKMNKWNYFSDLRNTQSYIVCWSSV